MEIFCVVPSVLMMDAGTAADVFIIGLAVLCGFLPYHELAGVPLFHFINGDGIASEEIGVATHTSSQ